MTSFNAQLFRGNDWVADLTIEAASEKAAARIAKRKHPGTRAFINGSTKAI